MVILVCHRVLYLDTVVMGNLPRGCASISPMTLWCLMTLLELAVMPCMCLSLLDGLNHKEVRQSLKGTAVFAGSQP